MTSIQETLPEPFYTAPDFTLYEGNSLEILTGAPEESVDLVIADPPYLLNLADWDQSQGAEKDFAFHRAWLSACRRLLKPDGGLWLSGLGRSLHQCALALEELGYAIRATVVWWKPNLTHTSSRFLISNHETLLFAAKSKEAQPFFNQAILRAWRKNYLLRSVCSTCGTTGFLEIAHTAGEPMGSVWAIPSTPAQEKTHGFHPTQKPCDLLLRLIFASSREGDLVLDPFCGTGTTGLVAHRHHRRFVGIDAKRDYLNIAVRRWEHQARTEKDPPTVA